MAAATRIGGLRCRRWVSRQPSLKHTCYFLSGLMHTFVAWGKPLVVSCHQVLVAVGGPSRVSLSTLARPTR